MNYYEVIALKIKGMVEVNSKELTAFLAVLNRSHSSYELDQIRRYL